MVKQFLPGMLERRGGRIIAVSSISAKVALPLASIYTATKYGVDGFMETLYDELCIDDYDKFIHLTTVYPYFINTRKELADAVDEMGDIVQRLEPEFVADSLVKGALLNKRQIVVSPTMLYLIVQ